MQANVHGIHISLKNIQKSMFHACLLAGIQMLNNLLSMLNAQVGVQPL
jgi:hypothetical protein